MSNNIKRYAKKLRKRKPKFSYKLMQHMATFAIVGFLVSQINSHDGDEALFLHSLLEELKQRNKPSIVKKINEVISQFSTRGPKS